MSALPPKADILQGGPCPLSAMSRHLLGDWSRGKGVVDRPTNYEKRFAVDQHNGTRG